MFREDTIDPALFANSRIFPMSLLISPNSRSNMLETPVKLLIIMSKRYSSIVNPTVIKIKNIVRVTNNMLVVIVVSIIELIDSGCCELRNPPLKRVSGSFLKIWAINSL